MALLQLHRLNTLQALRFTRGALRFHHSTMQRDQESTVNKLSKYTTCDISDALCKLQHPHGGFLSNLTMWSPERQGGQTRIVGPAYTVQYVPADDPASKLENHYIDSVPRGSVIFVSCPPRSRNAAYGGLMTQRARASGAVGAVIDGRFRDLEEQRALNFPVFARDIGTAPPYHEMKVSAVNVPVVHRDEGQDTTVDPGDYIVADQNGVVVLPKQLGEQILPLMAKQGEADSKMAIDIAAGGSFMEASRRHRR